MPDRKPAAAGHAALYDTPRYQRFRRLPDPGYCSQMARGRRGGGAVYRGDPGHERGEKQFFPTSDRPEVLVEVQLPYGSSISQTSAAAAKIEHWLQRQPEAKIVTSYIGQRAALLPGDGSGIARSLLRQTGGVDRRAGVPARRSSGGCGRRWPMAWRREARCASLSWCLALIRLIRSPGG
ncbi:hypothetical protein LN650_13260 [Klebsiella pneumoniae subsp. pneumoniae]|nr:hypothetical protein [Klebsiella pneumoniae subsp. pneumoniae]